MYKFYIGCSSNIGHYEQVAVVINKYYGISTGLLVTSRKLYYSRIQGQQIRYLVITVIIVMVHLFKIFLKEC